MHSEKHRHFETAGGYKELEYTVSPYFVCCRLNEGHTKYVERAIVGRMCGEKRRQFEANSGWGTLQYTVSF